MTRHEPISDLQSGLFESSAEAVWVWYSVKGDFQWGSLTTAQIEELAKTGELRAEDGVWKDGMQDWKPAGEVFGFNWRQPIEPAVSDDAEHSSSVLSESPSADLVNLNTESNSNYAQDDFHKWRNCGSQDSSAEGVSSESPLARSAASIGHMAEASSYRPPDGSRFTTDQIKALAKAANLRAEDLMRSDMEDWKQEGEVADSNEPVQSSPFSNSHSTESAGVMGESNSSYVEDNSLRRRNGTDDPDDGRPNRQVGLTPCEFGKPAKSDGSSGLPTADSVSLILEVRHVDGHKEEIYLANGLTIGRTVANTVALKDDETVGRTHARVEFGDDGAARLRCVSDGNQISQGDTTVAEIGLTAGVTFRIGRTNFSCVAGRRVVHDDRSLPGSVCPHCRSQDVPSASPQTVACPHCGQAILALDLGSDYPCPFVVPVKYGDFEAERFVARGGMGFVLRGRSQRIKKTVAIKLIFPDKFQATERFEQEVALMERVSHPNVVRLLSHGRTGAMNFLVMEWVDGQSLRDKISADRKAHRLPSLDDVLPWLEQICAGLAAVHAVGVVHRDIKPANILIGRNGRVFLSDLGVAKRFDQGESGLTTTGHLPGTFEYMAPEQSIAPDTVGPGTDLYALGVTIYELLTTARPIGAWHPASSINSTVPSAVDGILVRLLAPTLASRYASAEAVSADLSKLRQEQNYSKRTRASQPSVANVLGRAMRWLLNACSNAPQSILNPEEQLRADNPNGGRSSSAFKKVAWALLAAMYLYTRNISHPPQQRQAELPFGSPQPTFPNRRVTDTQCSGGVEAKPRRYDAGPLTAADFRADIPKTGMSSGGVTIHAFSVVETHYLHRYRTSQTNGRWQATLESIEVFAVLHREKSWNSQPWNKELLDYHQGIFDIQHLWALKASQEVTHHNIRTDRLASIGTTEKEAVRELERRVHEAMKPFLDATSASQKNYIQLTNYGLNKVAVAEQRKAQLAAIVAQQIIEELEQQRKPSEVDGG